MTTNPHEHDQSPWTRRDCLRSGGAALLAATVGGAAAAPGAEPPRPLRVLSFNILAGGRRGLEGCANLIRSSMADIVGLQEVNGSGPRLEELTGFHRFERGSKQILSRYPIGDASAENYGVKIDIPGTGSMWMFNEHLRPAPYPPYQLAGIPYGKGNPFITTAAEAVSEAKRAHERELDLLLQDMAPALESSLPVILTGDFNEPSHLDWTAHAAAAGCCKLAVKWPTSARLAAAGMEDTYRQFFPDAVARRGLTWTPTPAKRDVLDRIDFIYAKGLVTRAAAVIGEAKEHADIVVTPFPSDHRAVLAQLSIAPPPQK